MNLTISSEILRDFEAASSREWLVTNGMGGFASGSLSGANTRRYHALLVTALTPPTGRMTLLSKVEEAVSVGGETFELSSNQYPGAVHPRGNRYLESFEAYPIPTFVYGINGVRLEKRIWMAEGENSTYIQYKLNESTGPVSLRFSPLVCWKDFHSEMHPWDGFPSSMEAVAGETRIRFTSDSPILRLIAKGTKWEPAGYWHYNLQHQREQERGLDYSEDLYCPGHFHVTLKQGDTFTLIATTEARPTAPERAWEAMLESHERLMAQTQTGDDFEKQLVLAAKQFVIERRPPKSSRRTDPFGKRPNRSTIIAGYHWFCDWGRDTMIALPLICLESGRPEIGRDVLTSFAAHVSEGMLPNRFPDVGEHPEYNNVDGTLWYFEAIRRYAAANSDGKALVEELWPVLTDIIDWHVRGTRYGIGVDLSDGLLRAGEPGVQLTWMDARIGGWVVTPRIGKPVEINALWYNALRTMEDFAYQLGQPSCEFGDRADLAGISFQKRFVRPDGLGLYDVLTEEGPDASIRPNQVIAASLHHTPLSDAHIESIMNIAEKELLTPYGLRTLSPNDAAYRGRYEGPMLERDGAYHQGTVWPWLLGAFIETYMKVRKDPKTARSFLLPIQSHMSEAGIGSISEVFDGDSPQRPDGCIAQAWSVAEVLRAWRLTGKPVNAGSKSKAKK